MKKLIEIEHFLNTGQLKRAFDLIVARIKKNPVDSDAYYYLSQAHLKNKDLDKASRALEKSWQLSHHLSTGLELAKLWVFIGKIKQARSLVEELRDNLSTGHHHNSVANLLVRLSLPIEAIRHFQHAYQLEPSDPEIRLNYAISLKMQGKLNDAEQVLSSLISDDPQNYGAQLSLSEIANTENYPNRLHQLQAIIDKQSLTPMSNYYFFHCVGLEYEKREHFDLAWQSFKNSKSAIASVRQFDVNAFNTFVKTSTHAIEALQCDVIDSQFAPILVVGMPRSGTSLTEQILAQDPHIAALGEQAFLLQQSGFSANYTNNSAALLGSYQSDKLMAAYQHHVLELSYGLRPVDKHPFNLFFADQLLKRFPNARIVILTRNKFDTVIGNFRQLYSPNSPVHQYNYHIDHVKQVYDGFAQITDALLKRHPNRVTKIKYESLVSAPEQILDRLYRQLDLKWDACHLEFWQKNYVSTTASKHQLAHRINTQSIGKFKECYSKAYNEVNSMTAPD
ncbi:Conserved protein containing sulfotransfer domain [Pseudoalteromonas luteoviolacea B = ATCC 29581]|nr:Conserved protein containing sulfotransfer domain [Pseudoalteromonas luteoviolacea B = ATCC 29581]